MKRLTNKINAIKAIGFKPVNWCYELLAYYLVHIRKSKPIDNFFDSSDTELEVFTLSPDTDSESIAKCLEDFGICVIPNFIEEKQALTAGLEAEQIYSKQSKPVQAQMQVKGYVDDGDMVWQADYAWSNDYLKLASNDKPVINVRSRRSGIDDSGMIDIFGVDKMPLAAGLATLNAVMRTIRQSELIAAIHKASGYQQRQSNIYINHGVTQTRGPHIDNNDGPHKIFLYLSDVNQETDGPYCYLPKSHVDRSWMSFERLKNAVVGLPSTEVSSMSRASLIRLFGAAGTAIITNQSGIHCGWPQSESGRRVMLVSNFY